jgi:hypothetical protein
MADGGKAENPRLKVTGGLAEAQWKRKIARCPVNFALEKRSEPAALLPSHSVWNPLQFDFVVGFLRIIGVINAAVWLGSLIFFTTAVGPAFFSEEMTNLLGKPYAGAAAQIVIQRYFYVQMWCAGIALAHLIAEWLYSGKPFQRFTLLLLMSLFVLSLIGGYMFVPKMKQLHLRMYAVQTTMAEKASAKRSFGILHGTSSLMNLLVICGVMVYVWQVTKPVNTARFSSFTRFKT